MKYLKLYESFNESEIHEICRRYGIANYTINDDGSIDINHGVSFWNRNLTELPLKFGIVNYDFSCSCKKCKRI